MLVDRRRQHVGQSRRSRTSSKMPASAKSRRSLVRPTRLVIQQDELCVDLEQSGLESNYRYCRDLGARLRGEHCRGVITLSIGLDVSQKTTTTWRDQCSTCMWKRRHSVS